MTFALTPRMSSYLFVLTVGELERVTADAGGVTLGVVTTQGKTEQGDSRSTARSSCSPTTTTISG